MRSGVLPYLRFEVRDFMDLSLFVVSDPLANLFTVLEMSRAHLRAVLSEPLPITNENSAGLLSFGPDAPIFVILDVFLWRWFFCRHNEFGMVQLTPRISEPAQVTRRI